MTIHKAKANSYSSVTAAATANYIQFDATPEQADYINRFIYNDGIHNMSADEIRAAWHAGNLTVYQVLEWQTQHNILLEMEVAPV